MKKRILTGTGVKSIVPTLNDGSFNPESVSIHLDKLISSGIDFIVLEIPHNGRLDDIFVREQVITKYSSCLNNRIPLVYHCDINELDELIKRRALEEVDVISVGIPNDPNITQREIYEFYKSVVARYNKLPLLLSHDYNSSSIIAPNTCLKVMKDFELVCGIYEKGVNFDNTVSIANTVPKHYAIIADSELYFLPLIASGVSGIVSRTANEFPDPICYSINLALSGRFEHARKRILGILPYMRRNMSKDVVVNYN